LYVAKGEVLEVAAALGSVLVLAFAMCEDIFPLLLAVDVGNDTSGMRGGRYGVPVVIDNDILAVPAAAHGTLSEEELGEFG